MTEDSDPTLGDATAGAVPTPPPAAAVLAKGHLHPAILLLRLLDALRQAALPLVLGIAVNRWFLVLAIVLFVVHLGYSLARYLTLEYTLTAQELRVREGLLERQERRIPLDRIQDLGFESTILRRVLGLTVVLVETASGRGVEARLDALSRPDADHLREILLAARQDLAKQSTGHDPTQVAEVAATTSPPPEPEWIVHRSTTVDLLLRGLTDLRLSAFIVTGFAALELAQQVGLPLSAGGLAGDAYDWLRQFSPVMVVVALVVLLAVVMAFGVGTSTLGNLVQFHGFVLTLRGEVLQRRFGLLTTRQKTLPRARIQRVTIEQPWLRRLLGLAAVKADSAGASRSEGSDTTGGWDVVVPLARLPVADAVLPALLPGLERATFGWQRGSRRLILRTTAQGVLIAALLVLLSWQAMGQWALLLLLVVPLWALLGLLVWHNLGFALGQDFFALQHGVVGRYLAYVPTAKVQAVVVHQSPIAQLLGLAELTVYVAGGSPTRLPDLTLEDARRLAGELGHLASAAAALDW